MISLEDKVIGAKGEGFIFFPDDFIDFGEPKSIGKSLERLPEDIDLAINPSIWGFENDLSRN